jgi:hypothetical protein
MQQFAARTTNRRALAVAGRRQIAITWHMPFASEFCQVNVMYKRRCIASGGTISSDGLSSSSEAFGNDDLRDVCFMGIIIMRRCYC